MIHKRTTKELLGESLRDLAKDRPVDKITVKEIAENCGMSKATFYNYFQDKYELVAWIYISKLEKNLSDYAKRTVSWRTVLTKMIDIIDNDKPYFRNALKNTSGPNSFYISVSQESVNMLIDVLKKKYQDNLDKEILFDLKFYIGALSIVVTKWYMNELNYSVSEIIKYSLDAIPEKLKPYLK